MPMNAYEENREAVLADLHAGRFDYLEVASRVTEANFFRFLLDEGDLPALAATYPTPRKKEDVPLWVYLSSQITMRLHGEHAYANYPFILHCGGLRDALGPAQVRMVDDPASGKRRLACEGYNDKNVYPVRPTPCDQDFLRKLAKDTPHEAFTRWYGTEVARYLHGLGAFDEEGIFLVDGSYLFVPDNERYENSVRLRFDEHNHPLTKEAYQKLTEREKAKTAWRRCYRIVLLVHLDRRGQSCPVAGFRLMGGKESETPRLRELVDRFVAAVGKGVVKTLIYDRGFLDGPTITHLKKDLGIDCVFPLKANMLDAMDAQVLAKEDPSPWVTWEPPPRAKRPEPEDRPEVIRKRERKRQQTLAERPAQEEEREVERLELKLLPATGLWDAMEVPFWVVPMRATKKDGKVVEWTLASTREPSGPVETYEEYRLRTTVEERIRQNKCFWDLAKFPSRAFSLITTQVGFVFLAQSLVQTYLRRVERGELNAKSRQRLLNELLLEDHRLVLYSQNLFAYFRPVEYQQILLEMPEGPRRRLLARTKEVQETMIRTARRALRLDEEE